jgi:flagellar hook protein FlgE
MALISAMQTAFSGMAAAETAISFIANNMANAQTAGFKASSPEFATQQPQTERLGAAPSGYNGGSNPLQSGRGVQVAGISTDLSPGPLAADGNSELSNTDIAHSLVELNIASNYYRANLNVLDTSFQLMDVLVQLGRPS